MNSKGLVQVYVKTKYRVKLAHLALDRKRKESELVRLAFEEWIEKQEVDS